MPEYNMHRKVNRSVRKNKRILTENITDKAYKAAYGNNNWKLFIIIMMFVHKKFTPHETVNSAGFTNIK